MINIFSAVIGFGVISVFFLSLVVNTYGASKRDDKRQDQTQQVVAPTRVARALDPCEEMALEESEFFRAAGTAIAGSLSEAKSAAAVDARNQLARMIRVVVDGASKDYTQNVNENRVTRTTNIGEEIMSQYVYQSIELTKPIQWSIYDLSDGTIQAYVCIEMTKRPSEIEIELKERVDAVETVVVAPATTAIGGALSTTSPASSTQIINVNPEAESLFERGRKECISFRYEEGIPLLMEAVAMGSVNAQYHVGLMYLYGDNVEKNSALAFQYMLSAANNGHKEAIFQVAEMYGSGTGVSKDKVQARFWYTKSHELGDARAQRRIYAL